LLTSDPSKFTCWFDGTNYRATSDLDGLDLFTVVPGSSNYTVLKTAIALFPTGNFVCSLAPSFGAVLNQTTPYAPALLITVPNWELRLPIGRSSSNPPPVSIEQLTIQCTNSNLPVVNFKVSGGLFNEIDLWATSGNVSQGSLEYLVLNPTTTSHQSGLYFGQPGGTPDSGYIQYISIDHLLIQDLNENDAAIHYINQTSGTSHHNYHDLQYLCGNSVTSPTTVFQFANHFYLGELFIDQLNVNFASSNAGSNGSVIFNFLPGTMDGFCRGFDVVQLFLEAHNSGDIICNFQAPATGTVGPLQFSGYLQNVICTTGGGTHTIVNVSPRAAWSTANLDANKLRIGFGSVGTTTGNLTLGTLLQSANWWVHVDLSAPNGIKTGGGGIFGSAATYVGNGTNEGVDIISPAGDINTITRGTAYQVRCGSAIIAWSAAVSAEISDPDSNPIASGLASPLLVPEGYFVTFSGAGTFGALIAFWAD
jgi:hypothetical protein